MRPKRMVASAALTAALALVALPSLAGSRTPSPAPVLDTAAFQAMSDTAIRRVTPVASLDSAYRSAGFLGPLAPLIEPAGTTTALGRAQVDQPVPHAQSVLRPPKYTLTGYATFYDNGTTAMRLPRGTRVVICGAAGCIERVVNDYGPIKKIRIVDLYRPDFFRICGCPSWSGTTWVTAYIY